MSTLRIAAGTLEFAAGEPWLMATVADRTQAEAAVGAGARIIAVREGSAMRELIGRLREEHALPIAVLTGAAAGADAALAAGAAIVDASGGIESPELPELCAQHGAALVAPAGAPAAATAALPEAALMAGGEVNAGFGTAAPGDRPLLLHAESPDLPRELAALARGIELAASVLAVCHVAAAADYLAVHAVLSGRRELDPALRLPSELRREPAGAPRRAQTIPGSR